MSELQLKGWLVNALQGCRCDTISPGSGSTFGFPDLAVLVPGTALYMPVELKLTEWKVPPGTKDGVVCTFNRSSNEYVYTLPLKDSLRPSRLRPSQIAWHDGFTRDGGYSRIALAMGTTLGWDVWTIDRPRQEYLKDWKAGFAATSLTQVAKAGQLDLIAWWREPFQWWNEKLHSSRRTSTAA